MIDNYPYIFGESMADVSDEPLPEYNTVLFCLVWPDADSFVTDHQNCEIKANVSDEVARIIYYLLYARYGNSPIALFDINQFKYAVFSTVFQYAPTWQKKLEIQEKLRGLTEEELRAGGRNVVNYALHPDTEPSDASTDELQHISQQTSTNHKRGMADAYGNLLRFLVDDVTERFLERFRKLFLKFLSPNITAIYPQNNEEDQ